MAELMGGRRTATAVIAASGSDSAAVAMGEDQVIGVMPPATGTGDFDASTVNLLYKVSVDGTNYQLLRDPAGAVVYTTVAQNNTYGAMYIEGKTFKPWSFVKVCTYQTDKATPQTQTAETSIVLILGPVRSYK